jgi:D-lactate dehydrogenase
MKVAFFSAKSYEREYFEKYSNNHNLLFLDAPLNIDTVNLAKGHDAVCVFVNDTLDEAVLLALASLQIKLIALRCAGFNNVDIAKAHELNIKIVRVPAYSPHAVAEHALALLLTLNRKTHKAYNRVKEGNFLLNNLIGFDVYGKTVGIIGTGKIGQCFAQIMLGMGCKVIAFDLVANKPLEALGVDYLPLVDVFAKSDIVSLHCPLTELTKHIINQDAIALLKPGMMLLNTSRGALIDTKAVIEALKKGRIGYLGIDVYEQEEKLFFNDLSEHLIEDEMMIRLMGFPNVLITAHQGFLTHEALTQIAEITLQNITDFEMNSKNNNEVE